MVRSVNYNWTRETFSTAIVGRNNVILIEEFLSQGSGDLTNYRIHLKDGTSYRVFNPNVVEYIGND